MVTNPSYMGTVVLEIDGWKLGHNENPDVNVDEDHEFLLVSPSGKFFCGDRESMQKLMADPNKAGFRARYR